MMSLPTAFARAIGQLADPAILRMLAKSLAVTVAVFLVAGLLLYAGLEALAGRIGLFAGFEWTFLLTLLIALVAFWLLFRIVALAVLQFHADEVVLAVERRYYPGAALTARKLSFSEELHNSLKGIGRTVLFNLIALPFAIVLLFTAVGPAVVFLVVNALLLGRELTEMVWLRHRAHAKEALPPGRTQRFLLGGIVAGMLLVPFLNLLAPVIGAAAATHLVHSRKDQYSDA